MTLNEYQLAALLTEDFDKETALQTAGLGLCEEAGEVAGKLKRLYRDHSGELSDELRREIAYEIGDCTWYCAVLASKIGYPLDVIAQMNNNKCQSRKERGVLHGSGDNR